MRADQIFVLILVVGIVAVLVWMQRTAAHESSKERAGPADPDVGARATDAEKQHFLIDH